MVDLVTLDQYKEHEGISSDKEDTKLESIVPSVSQLVKTYCANSFIDYFTTEKIETLSVNWKTPYIYPTETPIVSITSVEERSSPSSSFTPLVEGTEYIIDEATDALARIFSGDYGSWAIGPACIRVTYNAGYESVPIDLRLAVYDLITFYLRDEHKERKTLASATIQNNTDGGASRSEVAFPPHIKRVLDLYKNFV